MVKFLKVTLSGQDFLIPCHKVIGVRRAADSRVDILLDTPLQTSAAAGAGEVAAIQLVSADASDTPKTYAFMGEINDAISNALSQAWLKPIVELGTLTYPVTAVSYLSVDFSA